MRRLLDFKKRLKETVPEGKYNAKLHDFRQIAEKMFEKYMDDDLNISPALAAVFGLMKETNIALEKEELDNRNLQEIRKTFRNFDRVLGVLETEEIILPEEIENLIKIRKSVRKRGDFKKADEIRKKLLDKGIVLEDTKKGVRWKRK